MSRNEGPGNKRTARIVGNALLLADSAYPLSYRTVDTVDYQKAMLIFYEQGNISAFKTIFTSQYEFAVATYFCLRGFGGRGQAGFPRPARVGSRKALRSMLHKDPVFVELLPVLGKWGEHAVFRISAPHDSTRRPPLLPRVTST